MPYESSKLTTLDALLSSQQANAEQSRRPNTAASKMERTGAQMLMSASQSALEQASHATGGVSTGRRKFGSQTLPRQTDSHTEVLMDEINHLQSALVDKYRGQQKLVSGAQFRSSGRDPARCDQCDIKDNMLRKSKETIRSLKFQISKLEDKIFTSKSKIERTDSLNLSGQSMEPTETLNELRQINENYLKKLSELERTNTLLNQLLGSERRERMDQLDALNKELLARNESISSLEQSIEKLKIDANAVDDAEKRYASVKAQLGLKVEYAGNLERQLEEAARQLQLMQQQADSTVNSSLSNSKDMELALETCRDEIARLQALLSESDLSIRVLTRKQDEYLETVNTLESEAKAHGTQLAETKKEREVYKDLLDIANSDIQSLKSELENFRQVIENNSKDISQLKDTIRDKDIEIAQLKSRADSCQQETQSATSRLNDLVKRMTEESKQSALAVQKAISSSVRLCVVAPTVNVHVADKKMKFRTK